jgi:hypothetical protein
MLNCVLLLNFPEALMLDWLAQVAFGCILNLQPFGVPGNREPSIRTFSIGAKA